MEGKQKFQKVYLRVVIAILVLMLLTGAILLVYFNNTDVLSTEADDAEYVGEKDVEKLDKEIANATNELKTKVKSMQNNAEAYFQDNSQILSETEANNSDYVYTEAEAYKNLAERGFTSYPIVTEYSMSGEYSTAAEISQNSMNKHPMYQTTYQSANGEFWTIYLINGAITAYPVSYNMQSELNVQVAVSESETVTSYDSTSNKFYETIPNETVLIVKTVDEINAETLESLTL